MAPLIAVIYRLSIIHNHLIRPSIIGPKSAKVTNVTRFLREVKIVSAYRQRNKKKFRFFPILLANAPNLVDFFCHKGTLLRKSLTSEDRQRHEEERGLVNLLICGLVEFIVENVEFRIS